MRLYWSTYDSLGAHHGPSQFVITSPDTHSGFPALLIVPWAASEIASMQEVIAAVGGPAPSQGPSSMSRSIPSNPFETAKLIRFEMNWVRFVLLHAGPQSSLPSPPIEIIAWTLFACAAATQAGMSMLSTLLVSRPGPFSVARLNRSACVRSLQGMFDVGSQPRSKAITVCPDGGGAGCTTAVTAESAEADPAPLVAVTTTRTVSPRSEGCSV